MPEIFKKLRRDKWTEYPVKDVPGTFTLWVKTEEGIRGIPPPILGAITGILERNHCQVARTCGVYGYITATGVSPEALLELDALDGVTEIDVHQVVDEDRFTSVQRARWQNDWTGVPLDLTITPQEERWGHLEVRFLSSSPAGEPDSEK